MGTLTYQFTQIDAKGTEKIVRNYGKSASFTWTPEEAGTFSIRVDVKDSNDDEASANAVFENYLVSPAPVTLKEGTQIPENRELTYGDQISKLDTGNAVFVSQVTGKDVEGNFAWDNASNIPTVGQKTAGWTFTSASKNYENLQGQVSYFVKKAVPEISKLPGSIKLIYHPARKLSQVAIGEGSQSVPGSWTWTDSSLIPEVKTSSASAEFIPDDTENYETVTRDLALEVSKATPVLASAGTTELTYGQALDDSAITPQAVYSTTDQTPVAGTCQWKDGSAKPSVSDSGKTEYPVVFTPEDQDNYEGVEGTATVTVKQADLAPNAPKAITVPFSTKELTNDLLKEYAHWSFEDSDLGTPLTAGQEKEFTAVYTGENAGNYKTIRVNVKVSRKACDHSQTEIRNQINPTCTEDGYSGDTYCRSCEQRIKEGHVIQAGHQWNEDFTIDKDASCTQEGEKSIHCKNCEARKDVETIPMLPAPEVSKSPENSTGQSKSDNPVSEKPVLPNPGASKGDPSDPHTVAGTEKQITSMTNDGDARGSSFGILQLKAKRVSKNAITLSWKKAAGASGYIIFGNRCGSKYRYKQLAVVKGNSWTHRKLKKGTYYKYLVVAYRLEGGVQKVIASAKTIHVATKGGKAGNDKSVAVKKRSVKLKRGQSFKIKAGTSPESKKLKVKKHRKICFESSNPKVAVVSRSGKVKAKQKGRCSIYVYAQNGTFAKVKVTVR